jgi:hypothetical protein
MALPAIAKRFDVEAVAKLAKKGKRPACGTFLRPVKRTANPRLDA